MPIGVPGQSFTFMNNATSVVTRIGAGVTTVGKTGSGADVVIAALDVLRENDVLQCSIYLSTGNWLTSGTAPRLQVSANALGGKKLTSPILFAYGFYAAAGATVVLPLMGPPLLIQVPSTSLIFTFNFTVTQIAHSGGAGPELQLQGYFRP